MSVRLLNVIGICSPIRHSVALSLYNILWKQLLSFDKILPAFLYLLVLAWNCRVLFCVSSVWPFLLICSSVTSIAAQLPGTIFHKFTHNSKFLLDMDFLFSILRRGFGEVWPSYMILFPWIFMFESFKQDCFEALSCSPESSLHKDISMV